MMRLVRFTLKKTIYTATECFEILEIDFELASAISEGCFIPIIPLTYLIIYNFRVWPCTFSFMMKS